MRSVLPIAAAVSPLGIAAVLLAVGSTISGIEAISRLMLLGGGLIVLAIVFSGIVLFRARNIRDRALSLVGLVGNIGLAVIAVLQARPS